MVSSAIRVGDEDRPRGLERPRLQPNGEPRCYEIRTRSDFVSGVTDNGPEKRFNNH